MGVLLNNNDPLQKLFAKEGGGLIFEGGLNFGRLRYLYCVAAIVLTPLTVHPQMQAELVRSYSLVSQARNFFSYTKESRVTEPEQAWE